MILSIFYNAWLLVGREQFGARVSLYPSNGGAILSYQEWRSQMVRAMMILGP